MGVRIEKVVAAVDANAHLVSLGGEFDMHAAADFGRELGALIDGGAQAIVVDLLDVRFIDSTALGVLADAAKRLLPQGGRMTVVAEDKNVVKLLQLTGGGRLFGVRTSLDDVLLPARRVDGDSDTAAAA